MDIFKEHLIKAKQLNEQAISKALFDFIRSVGAELVKLNRNQLNKDSEDVFGEAIGFYSFASFKIYGKSGPFDMEDTGEFLDSLYVKVQNGILFFGSSDPKTEDILSNPNLLSKDLFGLTDQNLNQFIEDMVLPFIIKHYEKILLG